MIQCSSRAVRLQSFIRDGERPWSPGPRSARYKQTCLMFDLNKISLPRNPLQVCALRHGSIENALLKSLSTPVPPAQHRKPVSWESLPISLSCLLCSPETETPSGQWWILSWHFFLNTKLLVAVFSIILIDLRKIKRINYLFWLQDILDQKSDISTKFIIYQYFSTPSRMKFTLITWPADLKYEFLFLLSNFPQHTPTFYAPAIPIDLFLELYV